MQIKLTLEQKLAALANRYYLKDKNDWIPKKGDYYTTCRNDLELYQIVDVNETKIVTKYCNPERGDNTSEWDKDSFLLDFGLNRVNVPNYLLIN